MFQHHETESRGGAEGALPPQRAPMGWWTDASGGRTLEAAATGLVPAVERLAQPVFVVSRNGQVAVSHAGRAVLGPEADHDSAAHTLVGYAPPLLPADLGAPGFRADYGLKFAYVVGAMANAITSVAMVEAACHSGLLAFFGAAGLSIPELEKSIFDLSRRLPGQTFGMNLIHSPGEPQLEQATVDTYLKRGMDLVSASAYMRMTAPLVQYRLTGAKRDQHGRVHCPNRIVAKVSREEVARLFLSPPPPKIVGHLVAQGRISAAEAQLADKVCMCDDLTAEADSGGHTDNRPALALLSSMIALRDAMCRQHEHRKSPRVGLAGGIATPQAVSAAFAMGAAYVLTGSINQACVEAGTSALVRQMLSQASQADVVMAPSADMFELGVKVQVLKRGTMFPQRAHKLYELYLNHQCFDDIPEAERQVVERDFFQQSFEAQWTDTKAYFNRRDPTQIERARQDERHRMALVFRAYLGQSSHWAKKGDVDRQIDYQVWCGPAMGAFNEWTRDTFLARPENRRTVDVALNLMHGAAALARLQQLRNQGVALPFGAEQFPPRRREDLAAQLAA